MFGLFGFCALLLPVACGFFVFLRVKAPNDNRYILKTVLSVFIVLFFSSLLYTFTGAAENVSNKDFFSALGGLYNISSQSDNVFTAGAGLFSGIVGYTLHYCFGNPPDVIIEFLVLFVLIMVVTGLSMQDLGRAAKKPVDYVRKSRAAAIEHAQQEQEEEISPVPTFDPDYHYNYPQNDKPDKKGWFLIPSIGGKKRKKAAEVVPLSTTYGGGIDIPISTGSYTPSANAGVDIDLPFSIEQNGKRVDVIGAEDENAVVKSPVDDLFGAIKLANEGEGANAAATVVAKDISTAHSSGEVYEEGAKQPNPESVPISPTGQGTRTKREKKAYKFPPLRLLHPPYNSDDSGAITELKNNADKLVETLKSFGVLANIINICRGPSVTRYELQPAPGVKISKITNLADDIALNLAANGVRIEAPIPGKPAVGIEIPNKIVTTVSMRELVDSDIFRNGKSKLTCVLGKDISGNIVSANLDEMPHLLIAGTTGSGKSVCVNSILLSILFKANPDEVKLLLIDPKMVEFSKYKGIPHLLVSVVSDAKKAAGALNWAVTEMLQRYKMFSEYDVKNITGFNKLVEDNLEYIASNPQVDGEEMVLEVNGLPVPKEKLPFIVIAIDELADLMMAAPSEVEDAICRLAQMARAAGMHLVIATQRPSVNVITGVIKANIPSRISLKVSSQVDSRTILDIGGAEKLIGRGDMLFAPVGAPKPIRVQGCYASDEEIEGVTKYIKTAYQAQYNEEVEEKIRRIAAEELNKSKKESAMTLDGEEVDEKMEEAIKIVIDAGQASTSMIQRRIKVGYARAGRMIDDMEQMGIVGPHQGSKPRDVLMTYQQWLERRNYTGTLTDGDGGGYDDE
jgi:S-DNA-T family DNA segregation ATPase FtsK/SpoIIIE